MRPLATYISNDLKKRSQDQHYFNTILSRILPPPLNQHVWVSAVEQGVLRLHTDGPAWATQLRYQQHEVLKQLNSDPAIKLIKLQVSVSYRSLQEPSENKPRHSLTQAARQAIRESATTISDPEIRAVFEKLSNR